MATYEDFKRQMTNKKKNQPEVKASGSSTYEDFKYQMTGKRSSADTTDYQKAYSDYLKYLNPGWQRQASEALKGMDYGLGAQDREYRNNNAVKVQPAAVTGNAPKVLGGSAVTVDNVSKVFKDAEENRKKKYETDMANLHPSNWVNNGRKALDNIKGLELMTDKEKDLYAYYYGQGDKKTANEYLDSLNLSKRAAKSSGGRTYSGGTVGSGRSLDEGVAAKTRSDMYAADLAGLDKNSEAYKKGLAEIENREKFYQVKKDNPNSGLIINKLISPNMYEQQNKNGTEFLTDQERALYAYYLGLGEKDKAAQYLEDIQLNARRRGEILKATEQDARNNPLLNSMSSAWYNTGKPIEGAYDLVNRLTGEKLPEANSFMISGDIANRQRDTVREKINNPVGGFLYDTGMSAVDSLMAALLPGGLGSLALGASAMRDAMSDAAEKGATTEQIVMQGLAQGIAETLFEKISIGELKRFKEVPINGKKDILFNFLKSTFTNASEEGLTELSNVITDYLIMGKNGDNPDAKSIYEAVRNSLGRIGLAALGGGLMGGPFSLAGSVNSYVDSSLRGRNVTSEDLQAAMQYGREYNNADINRMAAAIDAKQATGSKVTNFEKGNLMKNVDYAKAQEQNKVLNMLRELQQKAAEEKKTSTADKVTTEENKTATEGTGERTEAFDKETKSFYGKNGQTVLEENWARNENKMSRMAYENAIYDSYMQGVNHRAFEATERSAVLSEAERKLAYNAGVQDRWDSVDKAVFAPADKPGVVDSDAAREVYVADKNGFNYADTVAKALGAQIEFNYDAKGNGYFDGNKVVINPNSGISFKAVVNHEFTHMLERYSGKAYDAYRNYVMDTLYKGDKAAVDTEVNRIIDLYARNNVKLDYDGAVKEMVADAAENFLNSEESINEFVKALSPDDRSVVQKIVDFIKEAVAKLKAAIKDAPAETQTGKMLRKDLEQMQQAEKLWIKAAASIQKGTTSQVKESAASISEKQHMITADGRDVKNLSDVLNMAEHRQFMSEIDNRPKEKFVKAANGDFIVPIENKLVYTDFNKEDPGISKIIEFDTEDYTEIDGATQTVYDAERGVISYVQMRRIIEGLIGKENYWEYESDMFGRGARYDRQVERGQSRSDAYHASKQQNGGRVSKQTKSGRNSLNSIPTKKQFSITDPVEQTKDLIAIHNLNAEQMLSTLELGGFPMPSIAITKADMGHDMYGDVSVLFRKDTIDPKAKSTNKVYSGDAYTPEFPHIDFKIDGEKIRDVRKTIKDLTGNYFELFGSSGLDSDNAEDKIGRNNGDVFDAYGNSDILKYAYTIAKGQKYDVPTKESTLSWHYDNDEIVAISKLFSKEEALKMFQGGSAEYNEALENGTIQKIIDTLNEFEKKKYARLYDRVRTKELSFNDYNMLLNSVNNYNRDGIKQEVDKAAFSEMINEYIDKNSQEYKSWLNDLFKGVIEKTGIRNKKDTFLPSGNRRSWEALHEDFNLANIVKAMKEEEAVGQGFGGFSFFGSVNREFESLDDIRSEKDRLQVVDQEKYDAAKKEIEEELKVIAKRIGGTSDFFDTMSAIAEAVAKRKTSTGVKGYLSQWYKNITDKDVIQIMSLAKKAAQLPTGYFEAKPRRTVGFDEIAKVVVPDVQSPVMDNLIKGLEDNNIPYETYKAGDKEARKAAVNNTPDIQFSITEDSEGNKLSEGQQEYFKDSKVRDDQGRLMKMYHGTPNGTFTVFKGGSYFTNMAWYAERYQSQGASSLSYKKTADNPKTYEAYLNITKPFDTRDPKVRKIWDDQYYQKWDTGDLADSGLPDWTAAEGLLDFIEENELDYDGLIIDEGGIPGDNGEVISRGFAWVPVNGREQVKSIDNLNPTDDPDIRYSITDLTPEEIDKKLEENRKLKSKNRHLEKLYENAKKQVRLTKEFKASDAAVNKIAKETLKEFNSTFPIADFANTLHEVYEYIYNNERKGKEVNLEEVSAALTGVMEKVLEQSVYMDETDQAVRDALKGKTLIVTEDLKRNITDWNDFRREASMFKIRNGETSNIDSVYDELHDQFPWLFDTEQNVTLEDMLYDLVDTYEAAGPKSAKYGDMKEIAAQTAINLIDRYSEDIMEKPTFADKKREQLKRLKAEHKKELFEARADLADTFAKVLSHRELDLSKYEDKMLYKRVNQEQRWRKEYIDSITKSVQRLREKLFANNEKKHIPAQYVNNIAMLLKAIDLNTNIPGTQVAEQLAKYKDMYQKILDSNQGEDHMLALDDDLPAYVEEIISMLEDKPIRNLGSEVLQKISIVLHVVEGTVKNANNAFLEDQNAKLTQKGSEVLRELDSKPGKSTFVFAQKGPLKELGDLLRVYNVTPAMFYDRLSGPLQESFKTVRNAEGKYADNIQKATDYALEMMRKYNFNDWYSKGKLNDSVKTFNIGGKSITLDRGQIMSLYVTWQREAGKYHITHGGINSDTQERVGKLKVRDTSEAIALTEADYKMITDTLTQEQKDFADAMRDYLAKECSKQGNEVTLALWQIKKYGEDKYFPIPTTGEFNYKTAGTVGDTRIKHSSFTKSLVQKASNPISLFDFMTIWSSHVDGMAKYNAYTLPLEGMTRLWNYKEKLGGSAETHGPGQRQMSVRGELKRVYGPAYNTYILNFINDVNGSRPDERGNEFGSKLMSLMKKGSVMGNARVVIQQPSAIVRAFAYIDPKYFKNKQKGDYDELAKWNSAAKMKRMGFFDTGMGGSIVEELKKGETRNAKEAIKDFITNERGTRDDVLSKGAEMADELTWAAIWRACKAETAATTDLEQDSEAFMKHASARFTQIVDYTQVYDSVFEKSDIMRSSSTFAKMVTAFMSEPTKTYSMLWRAATKYIDAGDDKDLKKEAKKYVSKALIAILGSWIINDALTSVIDVSRKGTDNNKVDDKYEWLDFLEGNEARKTARIYIKTWLDSFLSEPESLVPYLKDIMSIFSGYEVKRTDMQLFQSFYWAWTKIDKKIRKEPDAITVDDTVALAGSISAFFGIPVSNVYRDLKSAAKTSVKMVKDLAGITEYENSFEGRLENYFENADVVSLKKGDDNAKAVREFNEFLFESIENGKLKDVSEWGNAHGRKNEDMLKTINSKFKDKYESEIAIAAAAYKNGQIDVYEEMVEEFVRKGYDRGNTVEKVINNKVKQLIKEEKQQSKPEEQIPEESFMSEYYGPAKTKTSKAANSSEKYKDIVSAYSGNNRALYAEAVKKAKASGLNTSTVKAQLTTARRKTLAENADFNKLIREAMNGDTNFINTYKKLVKEYPYSLASMDERKDDLAAVALRSELFNSFKAAVAAGDKEGMKKYGLYLRKLTGKELSALRKLASEE